MENKPFNILYTPQLKQIYTKWTINIFWNGNDMGKNNDKISSLTFLRHFYTVQNTPPCSVAHRLRSYLTCENMEPKKNPEYTNRNVSLILDWYWLYYAESVYRVRTCTQLLCARLCSITEWLSNTIFVYWCVFVWQDGGMNDFLCHTSFFHYFEFPYKLNKKYYVSLSVWHFDTHTHRVQVNWFRSHTVRTEHTSNE